MAGDSGKAGGLRCPKCNREAVPVLGASAGKWVRTREGTVLQGTMRVKCIAGHTSTVERKEPPKLVKVRRVKRGF